MVLSKLMGALFADVGIDLGTANTRVCVRGREGIFGEPSVVAVKKGTREVLMGGEAVGRRAKEMLGRTPESIEAIRPLRDGVIADFDMTEAMLAYFLRRATNGRRWLSPRVLITVPVGINPVEKRAIFNAAERAGARKTYLLEEPRAAGLGAGVPIHEARAHMIVDVGAGTTDITVLSLADVVVSTTLRVAGDAMDDAIIEHLKRSYNIRIGANAAEEIKVRLGSACAAGEETSLVARGYDLIAHVPRAVTVTSDEVREALADPVRKILQAIGGILERTGPESSGDLMKTGILLCGGGVLLRGLPEVVRHETHLPVTVAEEPLETVVRGAGVFLERLDDFKHILESADDEL